MALLAAEVISNACKHAFPADRTGEITVMVGEANGQVQVCIGDDGIGQDSTTQPAKKPGIGQRLIASFVRQLSGTSRYMKREGGGTVFELSFPRSDRTI